MLVGIYQACANSCRHLDISFLSGEIGDRINRLWHFSLRVVIISFQQIFFIALVAFLHGSINAYSQRSVFI